MRPRGILTGDPEEALRYAAVGDDYPVATQDTSFLNRSPTVSKERMEWFARGFNGGDMRQCQTFRGITPPRSV